MSFDKDTRNLLAKMVAGCRDRLAADIQDQLQSTYGLYPDGTALDIALSEDERQAATDLKALWAHFEAAEAGSAKARRQAAYQQLVREIGFTTLNRLAALRLAEERGLVIECVRQGMASDGFQLYERVANGALGNRYQTYRAFVESIFDELALDLGVLFDRSTPQSLVFPGEAALADVLAKLTDPELAVRGIWQQDETIGWIYQYYNDPAERKKMRDESQAPRNSRELAVRNQFFTPRYVVEFLTDNTLGRIWYEMRGGNTHLAEQCRYLVRRPGEIFLAEEEQAPPQPAGQTDLSQEELLRQPVYISHRAKKDPREITMLDPAGGSGHFGLYCFDLYATIYAEAYDDPDLGLALQAEFPDRNAYLREVPRLILAHNIHIIDIDPRACQIAALALWLRAQRAWQAMGLKAQERPRITKVNVVVAEPMPGDRALLDEFVATLWPPVVGDLVRVVFDKMQLADEAGSLLKIEEEMEGAIAAAKRAWRESQQQQPALFPELIRPNVAQLDMFDLSGVDDETFWERVKGLVLDALRAYATQHDTRQKLFADEARQGFAFIDLCHHSYDVILMNPPFGELPPTAQAYLFAKYNRKSKDMAGLFVLRAGWQQGASSMIGVIGPRSLLFLQTNRDFRLDALLGERHISTVADLGLRVMDDAWIEAIALVTHRKGDSIAAFLRVLDSHDKEVVLHNLVHTPPGEDARIRHIDTRVFLTYPDAAISYWLPESYISIFRRNESITSSFGTARQGLATANDNRHLRMWAEVPSREVGHSFLPFAKGGQYAPFYGVPELMVYWKDSGDIFWHELSNTTLQPRSNIWMLRDTIDKYFLHPGLTYTQRTNSAFAPRILPEGCIFATKGESIFCDSSSDLLYILGITNSRPFQILVEAFVSNADSVQSEGAARSYLSGVIKRLPLPRAKPEVHDSVTNATAALAHLKRFEATSDESHQLFTRPRIGCFDGPNISLIQLFMEYHQAFLRDQIDALTYSHSIERSARDLYKLDSEDIRFISAALGCHPEEYPNAVPPKSALGLYEMNERDILKYFRDNGITGRVFVNHSYHSSRKIELISHVAQVQGTRVATDLANGPVYSLEDVTDYVVSIVSYIVGGAFGRWDLRMALDASLPPLLPGLFEPLPSSAPGMLIDPTGIPASSGRIVSEAWLRARPNAITLPLEGSWLGSATIPNDVYPIPVAWDGILVDDPGLDEHDEAHDADIVRRVQEALAVVWSGNADAIEAEACQILGVRELRDYFRKPANFFADHLKRYSKSRRQAPIYWPLSTASGRYTVWLYYHRLDDQTLYTVVNAYVDPKLRRLEERVSRLASALSQAGGSEATHLRDRLDDAKAFLAELRDFREELLRVAALPYKPNLNDGVIINAAPLHRLFGLRKWTKDTEAVWRKLEKGDYDWAHLAYTIWPDRVREVCRRDRSIAIAHGLEELCEAPVRAVKARRQAQAEAETEEMELAEEEEETGSP